MEPGQLGVTLPHEHLLLDFTDATMDPGYCRAEELAMLKLEMQNLGKIRQFPYVVLTPSILHGVYKHCINSCDVRWSTACPSLVA